MPKFMDFHDELKLPPEAIEQITRDTKDGTADEFGVRQLELFHNPEGKVYCLLDAPDAAAVRSHHAAIGVPCGEVHEVSQLLQTLFATLAACTEQRGVPHARPQAPVTTSTCLRHSPGTLTIPPLSRLPESSIRGGACLHQISPGVARFCQSPLGEDCEGLSALESR